MKLEAPLEEVLKTLLEKAKTLPVGTEISISQLFHAVYHDEKPLADVIKIGDVLTDRAKDAGLFFDYSKYWMLFVGLPCNIPFVIKKLKKNIRFDRIKYTEYGFLCKKDFLDIDLNKKSVCYGEFEPGSWDDTDIEPYKCTDVQWDDISFVIESCNFSQWDADYSNNMILDGTQWELELIFNGKIRRKIDGSNEYPEAWRIFLTLKQICKRLMKREAVCLHKPDVCPFCGSKKVKPYLYGMPTADAFRSGKYIIGGCEIWDGQPTWGCEACNADFIQGDPYY